MIKLDEDALICDFAETYRIYDYRALPARLAATYAAGLRHDARIMEKISGTQVPIDTLLLASIADGIHVRIWQNTKSATSGTDVPTSIVKALLGMQDAGEYEGFSTPEEFDAWRQSMIGE